MAEIASAFVSIAPSARGFGSKLNSEIGGDVDTAGKKTGARFGSAMKVGALAAVGGVALLGGFLKGAVDQASGLNEAGTKIEAIFGTGSAAVQKFADKGAAALGQNRLAVLDSAATFGTMGKAAGLGGQDLAKFSTGFATLSTDLASFNNSTPEEATEALGAALRGEAEPIRKFGVLLDDATLKNEAMKLGLISTTKDALTPAQKVLAAQAAIYKQTGDAQGDFQKTSGGLANQQRILSASFTDLQGKVGSALLPIVTKFVSFLNTSMMPALSTVGGFLTSTIGPAFSAVAGVFSGGAGGGILASLTAFGATLRANVLPALQAMSATFTGTILPAITSLASYISAKLFPVFTQVAGIITSKVLPILSSLAQFFYGKVIPAVAAVASSVAAKLKPVFDQLVATFRSKVLPTIEVLLDKFTEYQPTIQKVILVVVKIIGKVLEFAAAVLGKVLPPVIKFAGFLIATVVPAVASVIGVLIKIIGKIIDFGGAMVSGVQAAGKFLSGVKDKIGAALDFVAGIPGKVVAFFANAGTLLLGAGGRLMDGLKQGIQNKIEDAIQAVRDGLQKIKNLLPGSPIKDGPLKGWNGGTPGKLLMGMLARGLKIGSKPVQAEMTNVVEKLGKTLDGLKSKFSSLKSDFASLAGSVGSAFNPDMFGAIGKAAEFAEDGITVLAPATTALQEFMAGLNGNNSNLTAMLAAFDQLKAAGASTGFLSALFQSGNTQLASQLATAGPDAVKQASALFEANGALAATLGNAVATNELGPKMDSVRDEIAELRKDMKVLLPLIAKDVEKGAEKGTRKGNDDRNKDAKQRGRAGR